MTESTDLFFRFLNNLTYILYPCVYIPFLYPFNWLYEYFTLFNPTCFREKNSPEVHKGKVKQIQAQVLQWNRDGRKRKMCTSRSVRKTLAIRNIDKSQFNQIEIGELDDIIQIDLDKMELKVEPGMQMGTLTHKLLPLGLTIPVIPEFETLTVGGLINGAGLETSSHKYGLFVHTCLEFEVVLADGSVVTCSDKQNADLFNAIPMAYGTLGLMTAVTFPLLPAGKYIKLEYHAARSLSEAKELMKRNQYEFIEGIAFDKNKSVVTLGNFSNIAVAEKINHINRWYKPWYYKHVESMLTRESSVVEYIPTRDYYHRHTRAYFWTVGTADITQSSIYMFLFGWSFPINFSFVKTVIPFPRFLVNQGFKRNVLQDFVVPMDMLAQSIQLSDDLTGIYPIWICPTRMLKRPGLLRCRGDTDEDYVDIGIYGYLCSGKLRKLGGSARMAVKKFEEFSIKNVGFQGMYTDCYLSPEDFDKMFDRSLYDELRTDLKCHDAFPDVYEKVSVAFKKN